MLVSAGVSWSLGLGEFVTAACVVWRITNAKVKMSSSSPLSLSRKLGSPLLFEVSGSYTPPLKMLASEGGINKEAALRLTWTNSMGLLSPGGRAALTLVAGKALGVM